MEALIDAVFCRTDKKRREPVTFSSEKERSVWTADLAIAVKILVMFWILLFLVSRVLLVWEGYHLGKVFIDDQRNLAKRCFEDPVLRRLIQKQCEEAITQRNSDPSKKALTHLIENTYLCGYDSCSNIVNSLLEHLGLLACVVLCLILIGAFVVAKCIASFPANADAPYTQSRFATDTQNDTDALGYIDVESQSQLRRRPLMIEAGR